MFLQALDEPRFGIQSQFNFKSLVEEEALNQQTGNVGSGSRVVQKQLELSLNMVWNLI